MITQYSFCSVGCLLRALYVFIKIGCIIIHDTLLFVYFFCLNVMCIRYLKLSISSNTDLNPLYSNTLLCDVIDIL